ncbi:hypothetical protein Tco_1447988 [Tanacetum coccineum]
MIIKKDSEIVKAKVESKSLTLKAKKESSDEECLTSGSEDKEYAMAVRDFKKFFKRRECPKPLKDKNQRAFVGGSWSDSGEEDDEKYIKEMLKKVGLEYFKPMKTPMSSNTKLTKDEECESVDSTKYRGIIGTTHLGLWYPKGTGIETIVYADSDHAGDYVDQKRTSGICTFVGCCLTSWFSKKQTALAISTTEAKYVSARKACQQALRMKKALIDYDVRLDDIPIMYDNKGAIDLSKNPV